MVAAGLVVVEEEVVVETALVEVVHEVALGEEAGVVGDLGSSLGLPTNKLWSLAITFANAVRSTDRISEEVCVEASN